MKNRTRYIIHRNEYDLMCSILDNTTACPIRAVAGISKEEKVKRCLERVREGCKACIQAWLNEED
jgi:hypothetical protein